MEDLILECRHFGDERADLAILQAAFNGIPAESGPILPIDGAPLQIRIFR